MSFGRRSLHGQWSSRLVFVLAMTGAAIGLGNVWRFPYLVGANGGAAFVLIYLLCLAVVGLPLLVAEIVLGRRGRRNPVTAMSLLAVEEGATPYWQAVGWLMLICGAIVLSIYSVVGGWTLAYVFRAAGGNFIDLDPLRAAVLFQDLVRDPERLLAWHTIFMAVTVVLVARGVLDGLEEAVRWFMPLLLALLGFLAVYALIVGEAGEALRFMFAVDFSAISGQTVLYALGHAFFTLSVGLGAAFMFSVYLERRVRIFPVAVGVVALDTLVAIVAGLVVFPLVFGYGVPLDTGPSLIYQVLPLSFGQMGNGVWFGALFFLLLVFTAWTSAIALLEPAVAYLIERWQIDRPAAAAYVGLIVWALGILSILSFSLWEHVRPLRAIVAFEHATVFDFLNLVAINVLLPICGLSLAIFVGWRLSRESTRLELGDTRVWRGWRFVIRYLTPGAVVLVFLHALGTL